MVFLGCNMLKVEEKSNGVVVLTLDRPELHNAFNDELIETLTNKIKEFDKKDNVRLLVLTGEGASFCAGADLNWMKRMKTYSEAQNFEDSKKLSQLFVTLNEFAKPVIGKINGAALGGGVGLVSCCDYVIATEDALFGLTEVRLGLVPAVISPFVIAKIGESQSRAYFMSGERFGAIRAKEIGLVHEVVAKDKLEEATDKVVKSFLAAGPIAAVVAKKLIFKNKEMSVKEMATTDSSLQKYTCQTIAKIRTSDEGQEGMSALLDKRKANWIKS